MKLLLFLIACGLGWSTWHYKTLGDAATQELAPVEQERGRLARTLEEERAKFSRESTVLERDLKDVKSKLSALAAEYDSFKVQRRVSMVGRVLPSVRTGHGQVLQNARITAVDAATITLQHDGGLSRVPLKDVDDDLKHDAVWTEKESTQFANAQK